jgi:hypothetical protein
VSDLANELQSDYLFARPSVIEGVGRIVDVSNSLNMYNYSPDGAQADSRALYQDWKAIGHDVHVALEQLRAEVRE